MVQYTYSSHRTRRIEKIRKQRVKYPAVAKKIVDSSDIILEILDVRYAQEMRNLELEKEIERQRKKIIYVLNKIDLVDSKKANEISRDFKPGILVSCVKRKGIRKLRDLIKQMAKGIENPEKREILKDKLVLGNDNRVKVGIIGYPNAGKSSLLNLLAGKSAAGVGADAGYTKNIQKIRLSEGIVLIDSPGVIPEKEYSSVDKNKISEHAIFGGRSYTQVKEPEIVVHNLMLKFPGILEKHYSLDVSNSEELIEELGRKKGFMKRGGKINEDRTARFILKEWQSGEIKF
jgi:ribosome biogenesis GTPase A